MAADESEQSRTVGSIAGLFLLLILIFGLLARRRPAGGLRLAAPKFVPLAPEAGHQVAMELGAAVGELLDAECRRGEGQT